MAVFSKKMEKTLRSCGHRSYYGGAVENIKNQNEKRKMKEESVGDEDTVFSARVKMGQEKDFLPRSSRRARRARREEKYLFKHRALRGTEE